MPCPTCDHTMHNLGLAGGRRASWCPRCGTLKVEDNAFTDVTVPRWVRLLTATHPEPCADLDRELTAAMRAARRID